MSQKMGSIGEADSKLSPENTLLPSPSQIKSVNASTAPSYYDINMESVSGYPSITNKIAGSILW